MLEAIERLYGDFQERELPELVERGHDLNHIPGKALALIGMRRVGKTYLCYQRIKKLLNAGTPRENILYLNFEDDRLFDFSLADCQTILDVFYRDRPEKKNEACYFFFDEIQNIPNWERFIRRLIDTERIAVYVTGSSAKLLSAEIATGLRGRSLDQEVFPFSFEEYLSAHSVSVNRSRVGERTRLKLNQQAGRYCRQGGLPEIQQRSPSQAKEIAQSYVDAVVLRDVIERHGVSNIEALRALLYHVLRHPTTKLSVNKLYMDFKSRGLRVGKDDLYAFIRHLTDAYLFFPLPLWTRSEKKRQVNPKKMYVTDNGILDAYSTQISEDNGTFLENLVYITLRRTGRELGYYETKQGHEIDFVHKDANIIVLIQVAWSLKHPATREREIRALKEAAKEFKQNQCIIVTLDEEWTTQAKAIQVIPLWKFLLAGGTIANMNLNK
jgi:predicted AAA+ superfamily ATPase